MVSSAAQGRFAAEFALFLVMTAGLALVALRPELVSRSRGTRVLLVVGFVAVGAGAFLQGSTIVSNRTSAATALTQAAGLLLIAAGTFDWAGGARSRLLVDGGLLLAGVSLVLDRHAGFHSAADVILGGGAVLLGSAFLISSRRSVAARVAASASATLLTIVLVLSVSLSTVLAHRIDSDEGTRLDARAAIETAQAESVASNNTLLLARDASLVLSARPEVATQLQALATAPSVQASATLAGYLGIIRQVLYSQMALAYVSRTSQVLAAARPSDLDAATVAGVVGSVPVQEAINHGAIAPDSERASVEVIGAASVAVAVEPVAYRAAGVTVYPGVLVVVQPLDSTYLQVRTSSDPTVALALASRNAVTATAGSALEVRTVVRLGDASLNSSTQLRARQIGSRFYSVRNVVAPDGRPVMALVASSSIGVVNGVRNDLFRVLFIIALGGTLLALLLAAVVGERIGAGLRTLTDAAQRIQRGDYSRRSGVASEDEVGVLGGAFDSMADAISEQTTALQLAAEEETALRGQLEAVVAGMGDALVAVDAAGRVSLVNRAAEELLGLDATQCIGRAVDAVLDARSDDGHDLGPRLRKPSSDRWTTTAEIAPASRSGSMTSIPVSVSAGVLRGPAGAVNGTVFVLRDLRPERQVERMKSEFLSRIGHELRTPLTAILGYAELLMRSRMPETRAQVAYGEIHDAGRRLARIVEMLEFSANLEAGRSLLRAEPMSVRALVDEVVADWLPRLDGNHAVTRRCARGLPQVVGDRRWLYLSLSELVDNAAKFSPDGGRIDVTATLAEWNNRRAVAISVADRGVGLSEEELQRVFREFEQADTSDTRRFGGLGLGLSLVKRVAEAHGGTVTCTSTPQKGSRFSILLPI